MSTGRDAGAGLYDRFLESVRRWPGEAALDDDGRSVTYAELHGLAAATAAKLAPFGGRIGLATGRGLTGCAGYLGILHAGRTVVPLAPDAPADRLREIARAAGVSAVLTETGSRVTGLGVPVLPVPLDGGRRDVRRPAEPGEPEYILFTSGSTGRPKGVPIHRENTAAFLDHVLPRYELGPGSRAAQTFELTFDPSVLVLFASWSAGATVVPPRKQEALLPVEYARRGGLTHWFSVPSVITLAGRMRALPPGGLPGLRWSAFMGEPLTLAQADLWSAAAPGSAVENAYGPTELTVNCVSYRLPARRERWPGTSNDTVPIGRVYPHLEWRLVAEGGETTDEGELCVRGAQRFAGYLDSADDAGRFLPGGWYRTGDRVRVERGELVHLDRVDRQVKIRGRRVELGEIEAVLRRCGTVEDAVAGVDGTGGLRAVVVGEPGADQAALDIARRYLPAYMVPSIVTRVGALPLNRNGKIDRRRALDGVTR